MPKIEGDSRSRILDAASALFSEKGYAATSMRDIADAVGIKAASLYNHFKGKQELFDSLIEREVDYVEDQVRNAGAMVAPDDDASAYAELKGDDLKELVWQSYAPFFEDGRIKLLMRMLAADRYRDTRCGALYEAIFVMRPIELQKTIFARLVEAQVFAPCDIGLAAAQFHGPMLMLMESEADKAQAKGFCLKHTEAFNASHGKEA